MFFYILRFIFNMKDDMNDNFCIWSSHNYTGISYHFIWNKQGNKVNIQKNIHPKKHSRKYHKQDLTVTRYTGLYLLFVDPSGYAA